MSSKPNTQGFPTPRSLVTAVRAGIPGAQKQESGFGLLGMILAVGLSTAVVGISYTAYTYNKRSSDVSAATSTVRDLNQRVMASYSSAASFTGLTNEKALMDGVYPKGMLVDGLPKSVWNGPVTLSAVDLNGGTDNGFALTYNGVDPNTCANFAVNAGGSGFYDVTINGHSAMTGRRITPSVATTLCAQSAGPATVQFIQAKGSPLGASNPVLTPCSVPAPQTQAAACPIGQISSISPFGPNGITQQRDGFCNGAYGAAGWTPWYQIASTCAPICTAPAPSTATNSQTASCLAGRVTPAGAGTFPQTQTQTTTYACPAPTGAYTPTVGAWTPWAPLETAACAPQCVAPAPLPGSGTQTTACPAGQVTIAGGAASFTQTHTNTTTYSCPAPTGSYTSVVGPWSAWSPLASAVCAPKCVAPAPVTSTQVLACPAGYSGAISQQRTTTYACPAPTGSATPTTGGWTTTSDTCVATCGPAPATVTGHPACPAGQTGAITTSQGWVSAPSPTCWAPGAVTTVSNSCAPPALPPSPPATVVPVSLDLWKGNVHDMSIAATSFNFVATSLAGKLSGSYTAKITYNGQTSTITATCLVADASINECDGDSPWVNIGGGTFAVSVHVNAPIKGEQASGAYGGLGTTSQSGVAPGYAPAPPAVISP